MVFAPAVLEVRGGAPRSRSIGQIGARVAREGRHRGWRARAPSALAGEVPMAHPRALRDHGG
jgi:hypothetical protein